MADDGTRNFPNAQYYISQADYDFWTDPTHTAPLMAALMAGEFAVHVRNGDVYSVSEGEQWCAATGWRPAGTRAIARGSKKGGRGVLKRAAGKALKTAGGGAWKSKDGGRTWRFVAIGSPPSAPTSRSTHWPVPIPGGSICAAGH